MNKKFLLSTVAVASLLAACTQDEALEIPQAASQAQRPVAGVVEFTNLQTRFNEKMKDPWEKGDAFGAYLMDEFKGGYEVDDAGSCWNHVVAQGGIGERPNANLPVDYWKYQDNWKAMYSLVNYVNSNYKYTLNEAKTAWENPGAQLVEGNYLLMFPQNDTITNRRELWFTINPEINLELVKASTQYHVGLKNQRYLGYSQIYRNDKASDNGTFKIPANLHSVMSIAEIAVKNQSNSDFMIEKIVMKNKYGKPVPTLAYVEPAAGPQKQENLYSRLKNTNDVLINKDACNAEEGHQLLVDNCFNQKDARAITRWATTENGHIPYGLKEEDQALVYEYTINFPENTILRDNRQNNQKASQTFAYISLPPSSDEFNYDDIEVIIYGKKYDSVINHGEGDWVDGMLTTKAKEDQEAGKDNQVFTLDQLLTWDEGMDVPQVTCKFDDQSFKQIENFAVKTTDELLTLVKGRLDDNTTTRNMNFEVTAYGNGLEVTQEVVKMINDYEEAHNVTISMTFKAKNGTPIILKSANIFNRFSYDRVTVICAADQNITKKNHGTVSKLDIEEGVTVTINGVTMPEIDNHGTLVTKGDANIANICNDATMTVAGNTTVGTLTNNNDCVNCGRVPANVTIEAGATLTVGTLYTDGNGQVDVYGTLNTDYGELTDTEHTYTCNNEKCEEVLCNDSHKSVITIHEQAAKNLKNNHIKFFGAGKWQQKNDLEDLKESTSGCETPAQNTHNTLVRAEWDGLNKQTLTVNRPNQLSYERIGASRFAWNTGDPTDRRGNHTLYPENRNMPIAVKAGSTVTFNFAQTTARNIQIKITIGDKETVYNITRGSESKTITLDAETAAIVLDQGLYYELAEENDDNSVVSVAIDAKNTNDRIK